MVNRKRSKAAKAAAARRKENQLEKNEMEKMEKNYATNDGLNPIDWNQVYINPNDNLFLSPNNEDEVLAKFAELEAEINRQDEEEKRAKLNEKKGKQSENKKEKQVNIQENLALTPKGKKKPLGKVSLNCSPERYLPLTLETPARLIDGGCFNKSVPRQSLVFTEDDVDQLTFLGSMRKITKSVAKRRSREGKRRSSLQLMNVDFLNFSASSVNDE